MNSKDRAFTYFELLIAVVVVAIITVAAMPDPESESIQQAEDAARMFEADVSYAASASLARPDDPLVIRADVNLNKYWLARKSAPTTPINHPRSGKPYVVQFGAGNKSGMTDVKILASDFGVDNQLTFDGTGMLNESTTPVMQIVAGKSAFYEMDIAPSSGKVKASAGLKANLGVTEVEGGGLEVLEGGESVQQMLN